MNAQEIVQDFMTATEGNDPTIGTRFVADNLVFSGGGLTQPGGAMEVAQIGNVLKEAMPDFQWNVQSMSTQGNQVIVKMRWGGTHSGPLNLGIFPATAGMPVIPPTNKRIAVPDTFVYTVTGDKITAIQITSGPGEGFPEFLKQLGVAMPK